jgi:transcriptional regulator
MDNARMDYKTFLAKNAIRRKAIIVLRANGWTWQRIADKFKISRQRAEQIGKAK